MKDLREAYNEVYSLNEVSFTNTGGVNASMFTAGLNMKAPLVKTEPKKPESTPAPVAKKEPTAMDQWRAANPKLAAASDERSRIRGTAQTDNPLIDAEMRARMPLTPSVQAPDFQTTMKSGKYGDQGHQRLTQNPYAAVGATPKTSTTTPTTTSTTKTSEKEPVTPKRVNIGKWLSNTPVRTPATNQMNSYDYGNIDQDQLTSLLDAYNKVYQEQVKVPADASDAEALKGLIPKGDKVHEVKRKKLDAHFEPEGEQIEEAGDDPCWKGYTQVGMKKKGGREVPNCVPSKGVPKAKGYKKEEAELEENAANLIRLGLAAGTALAGMKVAGDAKKVADKINKQNKEKEAFYKKTLGNSYEPEGELVEAYDVILNYLMTEGFAASVENAEKIMTVMSDEWMQNIISENQAMLKFNYRPGRSFSIGGEGSSNNVAAGLDVTRYAAGHVLDDKTVEQGISQALANPNQAAPVTKPVGAKTGVSGYANLTGEIPSAKPSASTNPTNTTNNPNTNPKAGKDKNVKGNDPKGIDPKGTDLNKRDDSKDPTALDIANKAALQRRKDLVAQTPSMPGGGIINRIQSR